MSEVERLQAEVKKLNARATQAKMDLHDLSEELPRDWERIPEVARHAHEVHAALVEARHRLDAARTAPGSTP